MSNCHTQLAPHFAQAVISTTLCILEDHWTNSPYNTVNVTSMFVELTMQYQQYVYGAPSCEQQKLLVACCVVSTC